MEPTGHVGARDVLDQALVIAQRPAAKALPEIGVQIHLHIIAAGRPFGSTRPTGGEVAVVEDDVPDLIPLGGCERAGRSH